MSAHEDVRARESFEGASDRSFGLTIGAVLLLASAWPALHGRPPRRPLFALSGLLFVLAGVKPSLLHGMNRLWTGLGIGLGRLVSPLVMSLLYFLVIVPIGLLLRLQGKDPLRLAFEPSAESYWIERRPPGPAPDTMKNQF